MERGQRDSLGEAEPTPEKVSASVGLFPGSSCPPPSHFWRVALQAPDSLTPAEQDHLQSCARCRDHLDRVLHAVRCPDEVAEAEADDLLDPEPQEVHLPALPPPPALPPLRARLRGPLVVCPEGEGHFTSLADAVRAAPAGARVLVRPGVYQEALVLDKPLEILSDGPPGRVVVQSSAGPCLRVTTPEAWIQGLSLRGRSGRWRRRHFAVDVSQGRALFEACDITSDSLACVAIHGAGTEPTLRRCRIRHGRSSGLLFWAHAGGRVEDCDIGDHGSSGVEVQLGSHPVLRGCRIHDCRQYGLYVSASGLATAEDCILAGHGSAGVAACYEGHPVLRRCTIRDGHGPGACVWENGKGLLIDCTITGQGGPGVAVGAGGDVRVQRCRVEWNRGPALWLHEDGSATLEECEVAGEVPSGRYRVSPCVGCSSKLQ